MPMRKVLLLTYHFPPSGAVAVYRMLGLVRYLPRFGWQPIVVAPPRVPWEPEDTSLLAQIPPETPIERVPFPEGFFGRIARYLAPEAHWLLPARAACNRMIPLHRPDAILTSSPPEAVHLLGRWLSRRYRLPWAACFRDPWVTNNQLDYSRPRLALERWLERGVLERATRLIANTPLNQAGWAETYPHHAHKMLTIPNGFDPERFSALPLGEGAPNLSPLPLGEGPGVRVQASPAVSITSRALGPSPLIPLPEGEGDQTSPLGERNRTLTILHAGEFYSGRDPRPFFDALQAESLPVRVELLGRQTEALFDFPSELRQRGLDATVQLVGQVPYGEAIQRMLRADILLLVHSPGFRFSVPAKLYEYLGAGRPILALAEPDGDIAWALRESKVLHRIAPPRDVPRIRQALVELVCEVQAGRPAVPDPTARLQFTRERMAQRVAECLDLCLAAGRA